MNKVGNYFNDWNYKKHAKFCCTVYLALFAIDMTLGYVVAKKVLPKQSAPITGHFIWIIRKVC